jgi:hypothetical protein
MVINTRHKPRDANSIQHIDTIQNCISKFNDSIWIPKHDLKSKSCSRKVNNCNRNFPKADSSLKIFKSLKVKLHLTKFQKIIINNWLNACTVTYNKAVDRINSGMFNNFLLQDLHSKLSETPLLKIKILLLLTP